MVLEMKICPEAVTRVERFLVTDREERHEIYLDFDRIFKLLRSPGINSKELILPAYVAWRGGMTILFILPARQAT
jgi:hypothetical protein